jgi:8-oxo-dGTP diphosphatase
MKVAVDIIVYREDGNILFIERKHAPYKACIAFPGGFVEDDETIIQAAIRELREETGVTVCEDCLEEVGLYDAVNRDPRERVISFCFFAKVPIGTDAKGGDDAKTARFYSIEDAAPYDFAFDHAKMLKDAMMERIVAKISGLLAA